MIKLNRGRILEEIPDAHLCIPDLVRDPHVAHLGKGVVSQSGIDTCYKGTCVVGGGRRKEEEEE